MLKKILVPVDFAECSWAALHHAAMLARGSGAEVHVLHVWERPPQVDANRRVEWEQIMAAFAKSDEGREMRRAIRVLGEDLKTLARVETGDPVDAIIDLANGEEEYDMVVMGTHGRRGLSHLLLGSVAEQVLRRADVPVLIVRTSHDARRRAA
ncbi:MAG: universal stress protein [Myxococcales bacterium]|nr:universal stress protein [Myxococcales bacterium]